MRTEHGAIGVDSILTAFAIACVLAVAGYVAMDRIRPHSSSSTLSPEELDYVESLATQQAMSFINAVSTQQASGPPPAPTQPPTLSSAPRAAATAPVAPRPTMAAPPPASQLEPAAPTAVVPPQAPPKEPEQTPPAPPPAKPPSDADLYWEFTRAGFTSGAFFYVMFENGNPDWSVCNLTFSVEYDYARSDGSILVGRTTPSTIAVFAPSETTEGNTLGGGGAYPFQLLNYGLIADWEWC